MKHLWWLSLGLGSFLLACRAASPLEAISSLSQDSGLEEVTILAMGLE